MQKQANVRKEARWLTIGQAADYFGVSRDTLRRWEKKGKIKAIRSPTNRRFYTTKQLDQLMSIEEKPVKKTVKPPRPEAFALTTFIITLILTLIILFLLS